MKLIKEDYQELNNGDEIIYNKEHLYILDKDYSDKYAWVTDEEEDRFNENAPGWALKKEYIDEFIGQDDLLEDLDQEDYNIEYIREYSKSIPCVGYIDEKGRTRLPKEEFEDWDW